MFEVLLAAAVLSILCTVLCGKAQYKRAQQKSSKVWVLPAVTGACTLLCLICCMTVRTFAVLSWMFCLAIVGPAFVGTLASWWTGS